MCNNIFYFFHHSSLSELNNNLKGFEPVLDDTGKITGYKTSVGGADTVFPFIKEIEYIDGSMVQKGHTNDVASVSKTYTVTLDGTLLIFCSITYTKDKLDTITLNGTKITPMCQKSASGEYTALYNIPVKEGDDIKLSLSATNVANYNIATSYFMIIIK